MMETMAIAGSIVASCMAITAMYLGRRPTPSHHRTITITIEDSSGERAQMVTRSNRRVNEVKREFERLVGGTW